MTESVSSREPVSKGPRASKRVAALIFVTLASLGVVVSLVGLWVRSTLFDTESFMEVVEESLFSEEVVTLLGEAVSEQVVVALDVEHRLEDRLGEIDVYLSESLVEALDLSAGAVSLLSRVDLFNFADLAAPLAAPVNGAIERGVNDLVHSDLFRERLPDAVAFAHEGAVALIRQDASQLENVSIVDGEVRWYILPIVEDAIGYLFDEGLLPPFLERVPLPGASYSVGSADGVAALGNALGTVLPDGFGEVTIMSAAQLDNWQSLARTLDRTVFVAILVTVLLFLAALATSHNRRRTIVQFAFGSIVALIVAWIVQRNVVAAVDAAIYGQEQQAAVDVMFEAVFAQLRGISQIYFVVAAVVGLTAHAAGRPRWLTALRPAGPADGDDERSRFESTVAAHRDAFVIGGLLVAVAIWWVVGISLPSLLVVGAALGVYLGQVARLAVRPDENRAAESSPAA